MSDYTPFAICKNGHPEALGFSDLFFARDVCRKCGASKYGSRLTVGRFTFKHWWSRPVFEERATPAPPDARGER